MQFGTGAAAILHRQPVHQIQQARRHPTPLRVERDAKPVADLAADRRVMDAVDLKLVQAIRTGHGKFDSLLCRQSSGVDGRVDIAQRVQPVLSNARGHLEGGRPYLHCGID
jgi:hypothetical protein